MRIAYSAFVTLLAVTAVPAIGSAQVRALEVYKPHSLDHAVPVATVSLVGDIVALEGARIVRDSYGEPFVLGAAKLDQRVPSQTKVVFSITNATGKPIRLQDVVIYQRAMVPSTYLRDTIVGAPYMPMSASGWFAAYPNSGEELPPGASLAIEAPISPPSPCDKTGCHAAGFVVFVGRKVPRADKSMGTGRAWLGNERPPKTAGSTGPYGRAWMGENPLFTRAFLALLSQPQQ